MSNNAPSATTDITALKAAIEKGGRDINDFPPLKALYDALIKIQAQLDDIQNQINA